MPRPKPFHPDDIDRAFHIRAKGRCECRRLRDKHGKRCQNTLTFSHRGLSPDGYRPGEWEANQRNVSKGAVYSNIEILCMECFANTPSAMAKS